MTPANIASAIIFLLAAVSGAALFFGYYEKRTKVAELSLQLSEASREGRLQRYSREIEEEENERLRAQVSELQAKVDRHPIHIAAIQQEWNRDKRARAGLQMQLIVRTLKDKGLNLPQVTVRFIDFNDASRADDIVSVFKDFEPTWNAAPSHVDGSTLRRPESLGTTQRIIFESTNECVGGIAFCFQHANWAGEDVTWDRSRSEQNGILITIFPPAREAKDKGNGET